MWQAGELLIGTGDVNEDGELHFQYKPAASGYNGLEFHCWITARPDGPPGTTAEVGPDHEVADFGLRHMMHPIELSGVPWRRDPLPGWYWGTRAGLADLRVYPKPDPQMMALIGPRDTEVCIRTAAMTVRSLGIPPSQFANWCERALRQA